MRTETPGLLYHVTYGALQPQSALAPPFLAESSGDEVLGRFLL
jgi:hypothetical protein